MLLNLMQRRDVPRARPRSLPDTPGCAPDDIHCLPQAVIDDDQVQPPTPSDSSAIEDFSSVLDGENTPIDGSPIFAALRTYEQIPKTGHLHRQTPLMLSPTLSRSCGTNVWLKLENLQPSGSFKIRGLGNLCHKAMTYKGAKEFVCSSGGNAGLAAAYAGQQLGVPVRVFVPSTTPHTTVELLRREGAKVQIVGDAWDEADKVAREHYYTAPHSVYVPPFDHSDIWEGHSTLIDEIRLQLQPASPDAHSEEVRPSAIVCCVGGGGLLAGVLTGLNRHGWSDIPVLAVETHGSNCFAASMANGEAVTLKEIKSAATSLGAKKPSDRALDMAKQYPVIPLTVSDGMAASACIRFAEDHRMLVEMACGASLSLATYNLLREVIPSLNVRSNVVIIVCGGNLVSTERIQEWKVQYRNSPVMMKCGEDLFMRLDDQAKRIM